MHLFDGYGSIFGNNNLAIEILKRSARCLFDGEDKLPTIFEEMLQVSRMPFSAIVEAPCTSLLRLLQWGHSKAEMIISRKCGIFVSINRDVP